LFAEERKKKGEKCLRKRKVELQRRPCKEGREDFQKKKNSRGGWEIMTEPRDTKGT